MPKEYLKSDDKKIRGQLKGECSLPEKFGPSVILSPRLPIPAIKIRSGELRGWPFSLKISEIPYISIPKASNWGSELIL